MSKTKSVKEVVEFLIAKPGYLKKGNGKLALYIGTTEEVVSKAKKIAKNQVITNTSVEVKEKPSKKPKRLYFDIETSYNKVASWNIGYNLSIDHNAILEERTIICVCYKWEGDSQIHSLQWDNGNDKELLKKFMKIVNSADQIVGHNSDNYDIKWLRTRCLYHRLPMFPDYNTVDTLKIARTFRLNSKRLDYIGQFLKVGKKLKTGGFDLWKDIVEKNDPQAMVEMINYCKQDVKLLEKVHQELIPYAKPKTHFGVRLGKSKESCPECGCDHSENSGVVITTSGTIKHRRTCTKCNTTYYISNKLYKQFNK